MDVCVAMGTPGCCDRAAEDQGSGMQPQPHSSPHPLPTLITNKPQPICLFPLGSAQNQPQLPVLGASRALLDQFPTGIASPKAAVAWWGAWF